MPSHFPEASPRKRDASGRSVVAGIAIASECHLMENVDTVISSPVAQRGAAYFLPRVSRIGFANRCTTLKTRKKQTVFRLP